MIKFIQCVRRKPGMSKQAFREQVECEKAHPKAESYDYTMEVAGKVGSSARVPTTAKCHVTD
ncbi:MAG: hypothetical protein ACPHF4_12010 [Rubripirellula sp.]